jgi:holo-[acyl-carrier protein] synthase
MTAVPAAVSTAPLVGVDVVHIPTLQALLEGGGGDVFRDEGWLPAEHAACSGSVAALAATWAAKEATMKALGVGITDVALRDIEVVRTPAGVPHIALHGAAAERAAALGNPPLSVSVSHEVDIAIAVVVGCRHS